MNKEILIHTGTNDFKVFLQNGFYQGHVPTSHIHRHNYSEIHTVTKDAEFAVGDKIVKLCGGDVLAIPKRILHRCISIEGGARHSAFQMTLDIPTISVYHFANATINEFLDQIIICEETDSYNVVCAFINLVSTPFITNPVLTADDIRDYGFLINAFFSNQYNEDISLSDLAEQLHVSPRHAERLVKECTGNSFGKELTRARTEMAEHLIKTTDMSLTEIAKHVVYRSYAGFYKAMKNLK